MKITRSQLKQIIKEELEATVEEAANPMRRTPAEQESEDNLVNAMLDLQELRGDAYVVKVLREMADDIEREMVAKDSPAMREGVKKRSIRAIIKPIGRMTRYILKTLNYDEDRDVDYGIPGKDPGFVDDKQWAELKSLVQATLSKIPKAARADAMYDEIMTNIQKPRLHRTEIADFASAFDEYFIGLEAMVRDGDLK